MATIELTKDNFDLMIVDVKLPDGDGTELLKQLQLRPIKPLVVMISGFGTVDLAIECITEDRDAKRELFRELRLSHPGRPREQE